jgi:hypothetical protein
MRGPDNSVRVTIQGTFGSNNWANVFHAQLTTSSAISQADLDTWLTSFQAAYKTRFAATSTTGCAYVLAKAICYTPGNTELISTIAMTGTGAGSSPVPDAACSTVVSWLTNVYWRGGKPRTYLPAPLSANVNSDDHTVQSGTLTTLTTSANNFRTDVNALAPSTITATSFGFVSFTSGNAPRPTPLFFAITGSKCHPRLGTQRRRLGKWIN